ncbi:protein sprint isoform X2 [Homalodisca vitripennis]|uniref:protein sprint isoform X2 n=1 Tax=Homalodisca vitripennis TaxID=197043 RepID=UPI001EEAD541|nr:protein sprint isoform X2 [Homalodisca vitripennis]
MQGLGTELSHSHHQSLSTTVIKQHTETTEQTDNDNQRIADNLSAQFRIIDIATSRASLTQESCGESSGESSGGSGEDAPCDIGLLERLIRSHPVWFLPGIQRAGAFHLLQGKEDGNFVVRQSSQTCTMAISVRLPAGKGPYIEHYLIQAADDGQLSLESSDNKFESIPALIAHYAQCCDELPVQLTLPRAIREARNRQQLSSLALLGQEFWRYPMANPRAGTEPAPEPQPPPGPGEGLQSSLPSSATNSQASSLSSFGSGNNNCPAGSPTLEPELRNDSIVLNLAPLYPEHSQPPSLMSTFKGNPSPASSEHIGHTERRSSSNSPLQQLVALSSKTPPPPPPRWAKPSSHQQNFTVTTTVTFSMSQETTPPPHVEVSCVQVTPKIMSLEPESFPSLSSCSTLEAPEPAPRSQLTSPPVLSPPSSVTSPTQSEPATHSRPPHRRSKRHKESRHYQESDILESPTVYYRSSVADKVSDYEDIWGPESMSTFKPVRSPFSSPDESRAPVPDILERVPTTTPASTPATTPAPTPTPATASTPSTAPLPRNRLGLSVNTASPISPTVTSSNELKTPVDSQPSSNGKQGSPFYAEPADAIRQAALLKVQRRQGRVHTAKTHRHSDPATLIQWPTPTPTSGLQRIDSKEELCTSGNGLSSSVDNLAHLRHSRHKGRAKPVQPPRVGFRAAGKSFHDTSWTVDSSWEFIGNEDEAGSDQESVEEGFIMERRFPSLEQQAEDSESNSPGYRGITIQEIISQRFPELRLSPNLSHSHKGGDPNSSSDSNNGSRVSAYDNVVNNNNHKPVSICLNGSGNSDNDDALTVFSEPWDSSRWEHLLRGRDRESEVEHKSTTPAPAPAPAQTPTVTRTKSFKERLDPLLSPPRLQALQRTREAGGSGASIRAYALHLAADKSTTFAQNIDNFIACTKESREVRPQVVMRNMRQFMSGMKNYLVKHGEREFEKEVERERGKLKANEFLNLDAILEGVMHKLVVRPLREHLYYLFVEEYSNNGAISLLVDNIILARTKPLHELGIRKNIIPPSEESLATICHYLHRLQEVDSPLEKLENLLTAISAIFNSVKVTNSSGSKGMMLGADDFLPLFVWVLVQSGMIAAEIEAEYMWGLLHPSLLSGEGGYYLTTLSSAVHVLKNFRACTNSEPNLDWGSGPMSEFRSVLKIVVPDEMNGSIITKTLPVRPNMTTRDVCKIIAHKVRITNPQDYGLYKLVDGEETLLAETDCPQDIKGTVSTIGKHCMFAYKRIDAKIAWPRTTSPE